jgi:hypothetical protein
MELPPGPDERPQTPRAARSPRTTRPSPGDPQKRRRLALLAVAAIALGAYLVVGGGGSDTDEVRDAAESFIEAANDKDFGTVCDLLSDDYRVQLDALGGKCERFLASQADGESSESSTEIDQVRVREERATVDLIVSRPGASPSDQQLRMEKTGDGWRIFNIE